MWSAACCFVCYIVGTVSFVPPLRPSSSSSSSTTTMIRRQANEIAASTVDSVLKKSVGKLQPVKCALLLCDVQERFRSVIHSSETVIKNCRLLTSACQLLDIPIVVTEQYPKAFGGTVPDCFANPSDLESIPTFPKTLFSMMTPEVSTHIRTLGASSFIITGIEAHVCVQQTALDLLELGHDVHIIADACSSQQSYDREIALQRMSAAGAYITTAQSLLFMLMRDAKHPNFKEVSQLVVDHMNLPNEFN